MFSKFIVLLGNYSFTSMYMGFNSLTRFEEGSFKSMLQDMYLQIGSLFIGSSILFFKLINSRARVPDVRGDVQMHSFTNSRGGKNPLSNLKKGQAFDF